MKQYIKCGARILYDYIISLIVFVVLLYPFIGLTGDRLYIWLPLYSFVMFLLAFCLIYMEMKDQGIKEGKPQNKMNPYPLKGLVYGLFSIIPLLVVFTVVSAIPIEDPVMNNLRHVAINAFLGTALLLLQVVRRISDRVYRVHNVDTRHIHAWLSCRILRVSSEEPDIWKERDCQRT
ncbi:MAG: hypothetical protein ACOX4M_03025 [Acetivibrionales bacterium]|jgi:hypothetical protein